MHAARCLRSGAAVAVKRFHTKRALDRRLVERELVIMAGCRHGNIMRLMAVYESDAELLLVMERGDLDLFQRVAEQGALPEGPARHVARGLLNALAYLHAHGTAHRDVKLENLLLVWPSASASAGGAGGAGPSPRGKQVQQQAAAAAAAAAARGGDVERMRVLLIDLGVAKVMDMDAGGVASSQSCAGTGTGTGANANANANASHGSPELVRRRSRCGSNDYMAPEMAWGAEYGTQVDVWSAGVLLYILLCGFPPDDLVLRAEQARAQQQALGNMSAPVSPACCCDFPSPWWDAVSDGAKDLCQRMLTVDPGDRITAEGALQHRWTKGLG